MDYLPYQRLVKEADSVAADWEGLRGTVEGVVRHRLSGEHDAAERILNFDLPRRVAALADRYSPAECESQIESLFREEYSVAAVCQALARHTSFAAAASAPSHARADAPPSASTHPRAARRAYREPLENDIASMIDDMLSGQSA